MIVAFTIFVIVTVLVLMVHDERRPSAREEAQKKYLGCTGASLPGCPHSRGCDTPIACSSHKRCLDCA